MAKKAMLRRRRQQLRNGNGWNLSLNFFSKAAFQNFKCVLSLFSFFCFSIFFFFSSSSSFPSFFFLLFLFLLLLWMNGNIKYWMKKMVWGKNRGKNDVSASIGATSCFKESTKISSRLSQPHGLNGGNFHVSICDPSPNTGIGYGKSHFQF